jgi:fluoride exporter
MKTFFLIFFGGGIGSLLRYFLGKIIQSNIYTSLPVATLIINILASLILGFFVGKSLNQNEELKALIAIGFCGGFSTFSTFSNETLQLFLNGKTNEGITYIFLSVILCLSATYTGILFGR